MVKKKKKKSMSKWRAAQLPALLPRLCWRDDRCERRRSHHLRGVSASRGWQTFIPSSAPYDNGYQASAHWSVRAAGNWVKGWSRWTEPRPPGRWADSVKWLLKIVYVTEHLLKLCFQKKKILMRTWILLLCARGRPAPHDSLTSWLMPANVCNVFISRHK